MHNFSLSEMLNERLEKAESELGVIERVVELNCTEVDTWEYRDRKDFEIGNIEELALSIKHKGQCQPIVVVKASSDFQPKNDPNSKYIVIAGYRRWTACKKYELPVKAIVKDMSFNDAISVLVSENEKENVSDYSKGMFYTTLLNSEKITQDQLSEKLGIRPAILSQYLAFSQVPQAIWQDVGDLSRVSAKTAATIRAIANKGTVYIEVLRELAPQIAKGYGDKRLREGVDEAISRKLNRIPLDSFRNHRFKHKGKTLMHLNRGTMKFDPMLVDHEKYKDLIANIEKVIADFADFYINK